VKNKSKYHNDMKLD